MSSAVSIDSDLGKFWAGIVDQMVIDGTLQAAPDPWRASIVNAAAQWHQASFGTAAYADPNQPPELLKQADAWYAKWSGASYLNVQLPWNDVPWDLMMPGMPLVEWLNSLPPALDWSPVVAVTSGLIDRPAPNNDFLAEADWINTPAVDLDYLPWATLKWSQVPWRKIDWHTLSTSAYTAGTLAGLLLALAQGTLQPTPTPGGGGTTDPGGGGGTDPQLPPPALNVPPKADTGVPWGKVFVAGALMVGAGLVLTHVFGDKKKGRAPALPGVPQIT